jgi:hypothetical protein
VPTVSSNEYVDVRQTVVDSYMGGYMSVHEWGSVQVDGPTAVAKHTDPFVSCSIAAAQKSVGLFACLLNADANIMSSWLCVNEYSQTTHCKWDCRALDLANLCKLLGQ